MSDEMMVSGWFDEKFRLHELLITRTEHWIVSLRPEQPTLGSLVLSLARDCASLAELEFEEGADLPEATRRIAAMLGVTFQPDKVNYLALMMVDPHVHFHVLPRYQSDRDFEGVQFQDPEWPGPPSLHPLDLSEDTKLGIRDRLRQVGA